MKNKEEAVKDFCTMIWQSWTYARLTPEERSRFFELLTTERFKKYRIIGTYKQRLEALQGYYEMFLAGCGYKPTGWRGE